MRCIKLLLLKRKLVEKENGEMPDLESYSSNPKSPNTNFSQALPIEKKRLFSTKHLSSTRWKTHSTGKTPEIVLNGDDTKSWEACRQAFSGFEFTIEEQDKILGKAFGFVRSPYWGEDREKVIPNFEEIGAILDYLRGLGLSDDDISKVLKKFPEVVGCSLEDELKTNIEILEKQWSIKGKSLRNLLLRNPKVLGFIIDCKGDCKALCTRCWVRF
ncbi:mitochondrial transcription termination factor family protein isoform 2 [Tanacetum coccineum]